MTSHQAQLDLFTPASAMDTDSDLQSLPDPTENIPAYAVRISARAKRMQLRITLVGQVEVVVPRRMHTRHVQAFVAEHREWIRRNLRDFRRRQQDQPALHNVRPDVIQLPAIGQTWHLTYHAAKRNRIEVLSNEDASQDLLVGTINDRDVPRLLQRWLQATAKQEMLPRLEQVSREIGLRYNSAGIRRQKTLWGSCSARQNISLNCNLLFVPARLMRYVFIHELCHTVHCNHSGKFWSLVGRFESEYRQLDKDLRHAAQMIPVWAHTRA